MKGGMRSQGFTIIETLIVLTVTSAMFVAATVFISGRQNKILFTDGIQDIRSRIQENINQVSAGQYTNRFGCSVSGSSLNLTAASNTSGDCVFIGKALLFGAPSGANNESYRIETIVGRRALADGKVPSSLSSASATLLTPNSTDATTGSWPDGSQLTKTKNGLSLVSITAGTSPTPLMGFAVVTSGYGDVSYADDLLSSGSLQPSIVAITKDTSVTRQTRARYVNTLLTSTPGPTVNPVGGIKLCFKSGTTNQSGLITLGVNNRTLTTEVAIKSGVVC